MRTHRGALALSTLLGITLIVSVLATALALVAFFEGLIGFSHGLANDAYLAAEAGAYDALLRLVRNRANTGSYSITVGAGTATITFNTAPAGYPPEHIQITSTGDVQNRKRRLEVVVYADSTTGEVRIISWKEVTI
jgi:hypothetical protein